MSKWRIGVYLRLSSEDGDKEESNSITTQKSMIKYYLSDYKDIDIYKIYIDDGYTGTDFDRPGFQDMLEDIYSKKINAIIVKDLSRLGRNYIAVGDFIENTVLKYKVRFISINDNVDSYLRPEIMNSLEMAMKNLMNESYAKDTSGKIRSSFQSSKRNGKYIGAIAPYGYLKDEKDCHKFVVDKTASEIVKKIFDYVIVGKSKQEIADILNEQNILTPSKYFKTILKYKFGRISDKWNVKMLDGILKDESYIGNLVQNKRQRLSHKNHNLVRLAEEEWIIVKDHHKQIIKKKVFYQVQNILYNRNVKITKDGNYAPYSGYVKCFDCNCNLHRKTKKNSDKAYYYCGTYLTTKKCSKHYITECEINETVLVMLNKYIDLLCDLKERVNSMISFSNVEYNNDIKKIKLVELNKNIEKQEKLINDLIKDYQCDLISKEDFEDFHKEYLFELNNLRLSREELEEEKINKFNLDWLNDLKSLDKITTITKSVVDEFINNIYICEDKNIKIEFKYNEQYNEAIRYLNSTKI